MCDVAQLIFAEPPEVLPRKSQGFPVAGRHHRRVNVGNGRTIVITFFADEFARVGQCALWQLVAFFGDMLGFRGHRAVRHRKIGAFADGPAVFAQVVAVGKKQELEGFELVDTAATLTGKIVQSLCRFAMGNGQTHLNQFSTNGARNQDDSAWAGLRRQNKIPNLYRALTIGALATKIALS